MYGKDSAVYMCVHVQEGFCLEVNYNSDRKQVPVIITEITVPLKNRRGSAAELLLPDPVAIMDRFIMDRFICPPKFAGKTYMKFERLE